MQSESVNGIDSELTNAYWCANALPYPFDIANLSKIRLAVFDNNEAAVKCYQRNGFEIVEHQENVFAAKESVMGRYIMEAYRDEKI